MGRPTEGNARVLLADGFTLLVGEEHISGETTLGSIGVCDSRLVGCNGAGVIERRTLLLLLDTARLRLASGLFLRHGDYAT